MLNPSSYLFLLLLGPTAFAVPLNNRVVYGESFYGGYGITPAVRAAPAFDGPAFAPVRSEEPINVNDIDAADDSYAFEYAVEADDGSHSRQEARDSEGTVKGRYTITLSDGRFRTVDYIADKDGFRARVDTNEPGTDNQSPADVEWSSSAPKNPQTRPPQIGQPSGINSRPTQVAVLPPNGINRPDVSIPSRPAVSIEPSRPVQVGQPGIPVNPDEPRTPHHPPSGFIPPSPFSRIHLAPPRPIGSAWDPTVAYYDPLFSSQWPAVHAPFIVSSYPVNKKR